MRLIDADAIYKQVQEAEELAQDRVIDTKETLPFQSYINPAYTRYLAQVGERTWMKHMIANAPTVDAVPVVRCGECRFSGMTVNGECKYCDIWFPDEAEYMDGDYYCASGERKDGGGNGV